MALDLLNASNTDLDIRFTASNIQSSLFIIHKFEAEVKEHYQHERQELITLNDRLRHLLDHIQHLESEHARYIAQISSFMSQILNMGWTGRYVDFQSDLRSVNYEKFEYDLEYEIFQLQIEVYQQLINSDHHWKSERQSKLEQELKQAAASLVSLRTSYSDKGKEIDTIRLGHQDTHQEYLKVIQTWSHLKKRRKQEQFDIQIVKNQIAFYQNLRAYITTDFTALISSSISIDALQKFDLNAVIKKIRSNFEQLYSGMYREMSVHYERKLEEAEVKVRETEVHIQNQHNHYGHYLQEIEIEIDEVKKQYAFEAEWEMKLKAAFSKFEAEMAVIQGEQKERFEAQSKEVFNLQESIVTIKSSIETMRATNIHLEGEIIIYRDLLECFQLRERVVIVPTPPEVTTTRRVIVVESHRNESVGIGECGLDGSYISLINQSRTRDIDISRWLVRRYNDSRVELRYTIPDRTRLPSGGELRIYARLATNNADLWINQIDGSSSLRQILINNEITSWGVGEQIKTLLFNDHGEEVSAYSQTAGSDR